MFIVRRDAKISWQRFNGAAELWPPAYTPLVRSALCTETNAGLSEAPPFPFQGLVIKEFYVTSLINGTILTRLFLHFYIKNKIVLK